MAEASAGATAARPTASPGRAGGATTEGRSPAAERGRTTIKDRALERLAVLVASEVPGVRPHTRGPKQVEALAPSLPSADATTAGSRVRLAVEVAAEWGTPLTDVAAEARDRVRQRVGALTGKTVDAVDVRIAVVLPPGGADSPRRVR